MRYWNENCRIWIEWHPYVIGALHRHVTKMSWRPDNASWRHFMTCKTISSANQHINLIPNLFPGFYYMGRSLGHFATCCRQPLTSWHDVMMSLRHFVTCKTISGANQNINLIPNLFPGFYYMSRSLGHFATCCRQPLTSWHDVMTSCVDSNMLWCGPMTYPCSRAPE